MEDVPDATVTAACGAVEARAQTAADGAFTLRLAPGVCQLRVERPGFALFTQSVTVSPDRDTTVTVTLDVASLTDAVDVRAESAVPSRSTGATKTDTPLIETPQSISVIPRELMDVRGVTTLNEAVSYSAGVKTETYGADPRYDWTELRGFDAYSPGFFRDGLMARNNGGYSVWRMDPYGLERVEVIRGPASVLYGQSNPGGLINVVSKRPTEQAFGEVQLQGGSFDRLQGAFDLGGPVDRDGKFLYRVTGLGRRSDFQVDFVPDNRVFLAPAFAWKPSAKTTVTFLSHYQDEETGSGINFFPASGTLLPNPNGRIPSRRFSGERSFEGFDKTEWAIGYLLEHRLNRAWSVRQNVRYGSIDLDYKQVYGTGLDPDDVTERTLTRSAFSSREHVHALTIDHSAQAVFATGRIRHTALVGLAYQRNEFDQRSAFGPAPSIDIFAPVYGQPVAAPTSYFADADTVLSQTGLYAQDQIKLDAHWIVMLGGRYDRAGTDTDDRLSSQRIEQDADKFTGRAGVVYLAGSGLAPYVSYSTSFFPISGTDGVTGQPFEPETGKQYEVGLKYQPLGQNSFVGAAVFDLRRENYLTSNPTTFVQTQTGAIRSRGLEVEAATQVIAGLHVTAAYTWLRDFAATESSNPAEIGMRQPTVPAHMLSLWADYRFAEGLLTGVGVGGGVRYTGSTFGDIENSAALEVPGYALLDLALNYGTRDWRLAVNVRNLTDKTVVACWDSCYYGSSRSVNATLRYRW